MKNKFAILNIRLQPGAREEGIFRLLENGVLKIRVKPRPIEGKANESLIKLLSKEFGVSASNIEILSGVTSKNKMIKILGIGKEEMNAVLESKINHEP